MSDHRPATVAENRVFRINEGKRGDWNSPKSNLSKCLPSVVWIRRELDLLGSSCGPLNKWQCRPNNAQTGTILKKNGAETHPDKFA